MITKAKTLKDMNDKMLSVTINAATEVLRNKI